MRYSIYEVPTPTASLPSERSVLMIYTGGTLGMVYDTKDKSLKAFQFSEILRNVPEIERLEFKINVLALEKPIDSSNVMPEHWIELVSIIQQYYTKYDGFVILHGTDTMAYTASALSFMLENLSKPVVLTGAQLPVGVARTDARENLITALEIAADSIDGRAIVPEVCIYFNGRLIRGNRAKKVESSHFNAFNSENYPLLADVGITIDYHFPYIRSYRPDLPLVTHTKLDTNVVFLKLFPGISEVVVSSILKIPELKGVIIETFGAGNATTSEWFLEAIQAAIEQQIVVLNISQCLGGRVLQGRYETSQHLKEMGVISGFDMTAEAAITKLMFLLGKYSTTEKVKFLLEQPLVGELTIS